MIENKYPYTNFHEMNLDFVLSEMKRLSDKVDNSIEKLIREQLDKLFINAMYEAETETLILVLDMHEEG